MRTVVFLVLGAVLLAGLFVVLRPGGPAPLPFRMPSDAPPQSVPAGNVPATAAPVVAPSPEATAAASAAPSPDPGARTFDLEVRGGRMTAGSSTITVAQGDLVVLRVTTDREDELHVHGYDLSLKLHANVAGSLAFQADRSGRFDVELHHGGAEIAAIEVQPR